MEGMRQVECVIEYYNLDAIISVGYRVNSKNFTKFRQCNKRNVAFTFVWFLYRAGLLDRAKILKK